MIPHVVACTGPRANVWSHLKSLSHTLARVARGDSLVELDHDRLRDLKDLLEKEAAKQQNPGDVASFSLKGDVRGRRAPLDLRTHIQGVKEFDTWSRVKRRSYEQLLDLLAKRVDKIEAGAKLFHTPPQDQEFLVLVAVVRSMLAEVESSLHSKA